MEVAHPYSFRTDQLMFSVIITCFNESAYIEDCVESVLEQTASHLIDEIIIVDDGSTDESHSVIEGLLDRGRTITSVYTENRGLPSARNAGILRSRGPWVAFLDGDDMWHPQKLSEQAAAIRDDPDVALVYTDGYWFGDALKTTRLAARSYGPKDKNALARYYLYDAPIVPSGVVLSKACLEHVGLFDETLINAQDTDLWIRVMAEFPVLHVQKPLFYRRRHLKSLSANFRKKERYKLIVAERHAGKHGVPRRLLRAKRARISFSTLKSALLQREYGVAAAAYFRALATAPWHTTRLSMVTAWKAFMREVLRATIP